MSDVDQIDDNLINLCTGILNDIEEDIDAREREVQLLFDQFNSQNIKYTDKSFLAEGGMKIISRVKDSASLRSVAMAELKKSDLKPEQILNFYNEARVTALLEHPNIVPIYEIGHQDGTPYFIMKEIQGETLGNILKELRKQNTSYKEKYTLNTLLNILLKVCDAISYAHSRRIVHLDLKPDNIHVGEFGEVLVIDWGLAKNLEKNVFIETHGQIESEIEIDKTLDGFVKGTVGFMAPEQARGENDNKDERTDIYSLGAILYSILTRKPPYRDKDIYEALTQIAAGNYIPLDLSKHPPSLCAVIDKAMEADQKDRYQEVSEFSNEIQRYLQGFATDAQDAGLKELVTLFVKRNLLVSCLIVVFAVILFIGTYFSFENIKAKERLATENARKANENAKLAQLNELEARENEKKALELFENLKKSKAENEKLENLSFPLTIRRYNSLIHDRAFEKLLPLLDSIHKENIDDANYWFLRSRAYLGEFKLSEAIECLKKSQRFAKDGNHWKAEKLLHILRRESKLKDNDPNITITLAKHLKELDSAILSHMFHTSYQLLKGSNTKKTFLKKALIELNPRLYKFNFHCKATEEGFDLDLSNNKNLRNLTPLTSFPLYKLNLSKCQNIESFMPLKRSSVQILDLSYIDSSYFRPHVTFSNLKKLYMRHCQFRYQWVIASGTLYYDFTGSKVDLGGFTTKYIPNLNLCSTQTMNIYKLSNINGLNKVVLPKRFKGINNIFSPKRHSSAVTIYCDCKDESCHKNFKFKDSSKK